MRSRIALITVLLFVSLSGIAAAQSLAAKWYWATIGGESAKLVAYIPQENDQLTILIEKGVVPGTIRGWRLADDLALVVVTVDGKRGLYKLTATQAERLTTTIEGELGEGGFWIADYHTPYALVTASQIAVHQTVYLVNLDTNTFEPLNAGIDGSTRFSCCRFSADGKWLRYVGSLSEDNQNRQLWEHDLTTGEERAVYTLPERAFVQPDYYGEHWLQSTCDQSTQTLTYTLIAMDGSSQVVYQGTSSDPQFQSWRIFGDAVVVSQPLCEGICPVELRTLQGDTLKTFHLPSQKKGGLVIPLRLTADGGLLARLNGDAIWLFSGDGSVTPLGFYSPRDIFQSQNDIISRDGRYVLTLDNEKAPQSYQIWDTQSKTAVVNVKIDKHPAFPQVHYGDDAFLLNDLAQNPIKTLLYTSSDGQTQTLPPLNRGIYFDLLPDLSALYYQLDSSDNQSDIYRYDVAANRAMVIVPDGYSVALTDFANWLAGRGGR